MIMAMLLGYLLYGSGGGADPGVLTANDLEIINQRIETAIADPVRADTVTEIVSGVVADLKGYRKQFAKTGKALGKLYKDHDAGTEEMQTILDGLNADWIAAQQEIVDAHFEVKQAVTEDEWSRVYRQSNHSGR